MGDVMAVTATLLFFALGLLYVAACAKLGGER
jgi:hypothetical protein